MARARGCNLRAALAGAIICWAAVGGVAVAQEGDEVTEDLGSSYLLARRTTSQGSIIETLLFAGEVIVTEIAVPAPDVSAAAGTTGLARTPAGSANTSRGEAAHLPMGLGPGFGGTMLTGEIVDDYLILHRTRASAPVTHEIFREGRKVGSVTEVASAVGAGRPEGRNSFSFESTDDRFVVHLTQPDGTRIHATTERGRFSGQVVERVAAAASSPRSSAPIPLSEPPPQPAGPLAGRSSEPQRRARPQESVGRITAERPASQNIPAPPETVPIPRAFPGLGLRPTIAATPVEIASPPRNYRGMSAPATGAPAARAKRATTPVSVSPSTATAAVRPVMPTATAPVAPKPAVAPTSAPSPAWAAVTGPVGPTHATGAPPAKPKPPLAASNGWSAAGVAVRPNAPVAKRQRSPVSRSSQ